MRSRFRRAPASLARSSPAGGGAFPCSSSSNRRRSASTVLPCPRCGLRARRAGAAPLQRLRQPPAGGGADPVVDEWRDAVGGARALVDGCAVAPVSDSIMPVTPRAAAMHLQRPDHCRAVLRRERAVARVGILDFDQHYGNGTSQIIRELGLDWIEHYSAGACGIRRTGRGLPCRDPEPACAVRGLRRAALPGRCRPAPPRPARRMADHGAVAHP